jgi:hypothetical protein
MQEKTMTFLRVPVIITLSTILLGACVTTGPQPDKSVDHIDFLGSNVSLAVSNRTMMMRDSHHGDQFEFLSNNGHTWLWYPGNETLVRGDWKADGSNICFRYGANAYNPVTKQQGGKWECTPFSNWKPRALAAYRGDIFDLSQREAVPCVLDKYSYYQSMIAKYERMSARGSLRRCFDLMREFAKEISKSGKSKGHRMPESVLALYFVDGGGLNETYLAKHSQVRTPTGIRHLRNYLLFEQANSVTFARRLPQFTR